MAATVKLLLLEAPNSSICYSGRWRVLGGDANAHVLHWARCNLHAGLVDAVVDSSMKAENYYATRVRTLELSADAKTLTLTPVEGISLRWRRAPEAGWARSEGPSVSIKALCGALVDKVPYTAADRLVVGNQLFARRVYKANLAMQFMAAGFIEPVEQAEPVLRAGWLSKQSVSAPIGFKNWRRRYVVLRPSCVTWSKQDYDDKPIGNMPLDATTQLHVDPAKPWCIRLTTDGLELLLETANELEFKEWRQALELAIQAIQETRPPSIDRKEMSETPLTREVARR